MPTLSVHDVGRIRYEFEDIGIEAAQLSDYLKEIGSRLPDKDTPEHWRHTHVCGSAIEKIYTGMERIMSRLASMLDGEPVGKSGESWHRALLLRMSMPYPGVRGRIICEETLGLLNNLRGFRHRERHSYSMALDLEIVIQRARDAIAAVQQLKAEVEPFLGERP
jgi:hypothetical protein